jgi:hypothetical protein
MKSSQNPAPARADRTASDTSTGLPRSPEQSSLTAEEIREIVAQILG